MAQIQFERLQQQDLKLFQDFCREHWPGEHPLIHNAQMFEYYYRDAYDGGMNFVVARDGETGDIHSVCGYIKASASPTPDVWISYILTKKGAALHLGFRLLALIQQLTNCRTIACNNIRKKTRGLYEFLGWHVADQTQYYRLNSEMDRYTICQIEDRTILPLAESDIEFAAISNQKDLEEFDYAAFSENKPYKDQHYIQKRYLDNPWIAYELFAAQRNGGTRALVVVRPFQTKQGTALRVVDYVGCRGDIAGCGNALDRLMRARGAEFIDWFAFGVDDAVMARAGFTAIMPRGPNIVPFYLDPPKQETVTVTFFTSDPDGYCMFRGDGDQDRPNLA